MTPLTGASQPLPCPPGTKILLEIGGTPDKLATTCVGFSRGRFVVTNMPVVPEHNREALHQMLYPDNTVIARFLHEGTVMGFSTTLIKAVSIPFPLLFLAYPARLEFHDLRRHPRVPCCIPASVNLEDGQVQGMITDLSRTGCQFTASRDAAGQPKPRVDERIILNCALFGSSHQAELPAAVKRMTISERHLNLGLKFTSLPAETQSVLEGFLHHALSVLA